jgi:hypothetical protein
MTTMLDADFAGIRAYRSNIHRCRRLLGTRLYDLERQFIERRLSTRHWTRWLLCCSTPVSREPAAPREAGIMMDSAALRFLIGVSDLHASTPQSLAWQP